MARGREAAAPAVEVEAAPLSGMVEMAPAARGHEDLGVLTHVEQELRGLMAKTETLLERGTPHGRRVALLRTKLEEAWLQAKQGMHEVHYGQW